MLGLMPVPGGYTWRSDSRLTLASPLRLTEEQATEIIMRSDLIAKILSGEHSLQLPG